MPLPNLQSDRWEYIECRIKPLDITNHPQLANILKPEDHLFCYAFIPVNVQNPEHYPIVVSFPGTGLDTSQGVGMQKFSDFSADYEPGEYLVMSDVHGDDLLYNLLSQPELQDRIKIFMGISLGTTLPQQFALNLTPRGIKNIRVCGSNPGNHFTLPDEKHLLFGQGLAMAPEEQPEAHILSQEGDLVSKAGFFTKNVRYYETHLPNAKKTLPNTQQLKEYMEYGALKKIWYRETFYLAYLSHIATHLNNPDTELYLIESVEAENNNQARIEYTVTAKNEMRPWFYDNMFKNKHPHLVNLPKLEPQKDKKSSQSSLADQPTLFPPAPAPEPTRTVSSSGVSSSVKKPSSVPLAKFYY